MSSISGAAALLFAACCVSLPSRCGTSASTSSRSTKPRASRAACRASPWASTFAGLASTKREDILAVRDKIVADPKLVTPMTLMVLAIRFYDVGLRDDAVFWFYAAKDRFITLADVVDVQTGGLAQADDAVRSFSILAGPFINGYAFCDIENQKAIRLKALEWVEKNPYDVIFMERLPAKAHGDRRAALRRAVEDVKSSAAKERAYLSEAANVAKIRADRAKNGMDEKFCWKP